MRDTATHFAFTPENANTLEGFAHTMRQTIAREEARLAPSATVIHAARVSLQAVEVYLAALAQVLRQ